MADANTVTVPRARLEAVARQALALREQADALMGLVRSELTAGADDPRPAKEAKEPTTPPTFGRRSA